MTPITLKKVLEKSGEIVPVKISTEKTVNSRSKKCPAKSAKNEEDIVPNISIATDKRSLCELKQADAKLLSPGMSVYYCSTIGWIPAKILHTKASQPPIFCVKRTNGNEADVPRDEVMSEKLYNDAMEELGCCHDLPKSKIQERRALKSGLQVYQILKWIFHFGS